MDQDLDDGNPVILEIASGGGSHFVVARGKTDSSYAILDPETEANTTLSSFRSARRLLPTHTNLSALLLVFDSDLNLSGLTGGELNQELPLGEDGGETTSGDPVWTYLLNQPVDGTYQLIFSADEPGWYDFEIYGYDRDGEVQAQNERIYIDREEVIYEFDFNQTNGDLSQWHRQMDFDQMLEDIDLAYEERWIRNYRSWQSLRQTMKSAKRLYQLGRLQWAQRTLDAWGRLVRVYGYRGWVTIEGQLFLLQELGYLRLSL